MIYHGRRLMKVYSKAAIRINGVNLVHLRNETQLIITTTLIDVIYLLLIPIIHGILMTTETIIN